MKKYLALIFSISMALLLYACGGGGSGGPHLGGASSNVGYQLNSNTLSFDINTSDLTKSIIPFPNDLLVQSTSVRDTTTARNLHIPTTDVTDNATLAFYTAINNLGLQGLSPNTQIMIPLSSDIKLDPIQLQNHIIAVDITKILDNVTDPRKIFASLIVKQNGNVINAYPVIPFNSGDQYVVVVTKGIDNLGQPAIMPLLLGNNKLTGEYAPLELLRETYVKLLPLLQKLGIQKDNILEMFTFKVAKKTLGLSDYALIQEAAETGNMSLLDNVPDVAYEYKDLDNMTYYTIQGDNITIDPENEYLQIDELSDLPLVCQNLYDNETIRQAYDLHQITNLSGKLTTLLDNASLDNVTPYMLTPNLYKLSDIWSIIENNTDNGTLNYPEVCKEIFDNATLYDNVTAVIYPPHSDNITGFLIFQHGLGRDKSDAGKLASDENGYFNNYLIFAMDLPWHGGRVRPNNMTNVPIPSPTCDPTKSGSCYLTSNAIADVLNIYQSLLDMHTFIKFVFAGDVKTMASYGLPPLPVYFTSQSMGSITGSMLLNIDNITYSQALASAGLPPNNYISKAVLNVGGANYSAILNEATNPEIMGLLCSALNIPVDQCTPENVAQYRDTVKYNLTIALFQLVLDPVDPAFMARNPAIKNKIIIQSAYKDTLVPNISNELLYADYLTPPYSSLNFTPINCGGSSVPASPGWYMFIGNDPYSWINHGFLIHTAPTLDELNEMYPSAAGHMSLECVNNAEELSREQIDQFFSAP